MKKSTLTILFTVLFILSCVFAACNANQGIPYPDGQSDITESQSDENDYSSIIIELEEQILALKQDQYISEAKRTEEIARLEALILELKRADSDTDATESPDTDTESGKNEDSESETENVTAGKFL